MNREAASGRQVQVYVLSRSDSFLFLAVVAALAMRIGSIAKEGGRPAPQLPAPGRRGRAGCGVLFHRG